MKSSLFASGTRPTFRKIGNTIAEEVTHPKARGPFQIQCRGVSMFSVTPKGIKRDKSGFYGSLVRR
jgi:hypothetical protein